MKRKERKVQRAKVGKLVICYLLVAICYLVASCSVDAPGQDPIPEGMGRVTLNLNGVSARTILPASNALQLTDFVSYRLVFTAVTDGEDYTDTLTLATANAFAPIDLVPGTYGLTVDAYKAGNLLAARGQVGEIDIDEGPNPPVDVTLRAVLDEGRGSFEWEITLDDITLTDLTATMTILGGTVNEEVDLMVLANREESRDDLLAGVYTVRFNLAGKDGTIERAVVWNELMYVYATLTSNFEHEFTNDYFHRINWNVTYDHNYSGAPTPVEGDGIQSVVHGNFAPALTPTRSGYNLVGWYTADGTGDVWGTPWTFATGRVHNDMILYAQWQRIVGTVTVRLDVEDINDAEFTIDPDPVLPTSITFSLASATTTTVEVTAMTIGGTDVFDDYTFTWVIEGKGIYAEPNPTAENVTVTGDTIVLNNPDNRHIYATVGTHTIVLTAVSAGGKSYQRNVQFTVTN